MATAAVQEQKDDKKGIVLIGIDSSEQAHNAFEWYIDNLYRPEHELLLMHVSTPPFVSTQHALYMSGDMWNTMLEEEKERVKELEEEYAQKMKEKKVTGKIKAFFHTKPGEALVDAAKDHHAKMVVMGTRGLGTIRRTVLGSVSDYVLHHVHCPVIIYRT